ncbi:MAG: GNAT family N-acetyltransferase [Acidobacteriota bacterium]
MTHKIKLRQATASDMESVHQLIVALGYPDISKEKFHEGFNAVINHADSTVFLATDGSEKPLGLMTLSKRPQLRLAGMILCIDELAVLNEARGSGIGSALLDKAKAFAGEIQAVRIELHTNRMRESYRRQFYLKNGFIEANSALMRIDLG